MRSLAATLCSGRFDKDNKVTERLVAALLGLLFSGITVAADFLVEVRVLVQRGCMLVNQTRDAGARPWAGSTWARRHAWTAPARR